MSLALSGRLGKVVASQAEGCKIESRPWLSCTDLYYVRGAQGVLPMKVGGATSQLDLPSLMPLSVADCGRLQLVVPNFATSVDYCKQLIIDPTFCGRRSPLGGSWRQKTLPLWDSNSSICPLVALQIESILSAIDNLYGPIVSILC